MHRKKGKKGRVVCSHMDKMNILIIVWYVSCVWIPLISRQLHLMRSRTALRQLAWYKATGRLVKLPVSTMSFFMCNYMCVLPKQVDKGKIRVNSVIKMYKSPPIHPRISGRRSFRLRGSLFLGSTWTRVGRRQGLGLPENQEWNGDWIETYLYIFS